jgi:hypothetical protein
MVFYQLTVPPQVDTTARASDTVLISEQKGTGQKENVFILKSTKHSLKSETSLTILCPYTRINEHIGITK